MEWWHWLLLGVLFATVLLLGIISLRNNKVNRTLTNMAENLIHDVIRDKQKEINKLEEDFENNEEKIKLIDEEIEDLKDALNEDKKTSKDLDEISKRFGDLNV